MPCMAAGSGRACGPAELIDMPYTHSGVLASALAMHKERAKHVMHAAGRAVADGKVVRRSGGGQGARVARPYVLRPVAEGSSVGVHIVRPRITSIPRRSCTIRAGLSAIGCWPSAIFRGGS